ncbi:MAG: hypothetical protein AAF716_01345 [Cyanobacteria bacterium P01_D01_bin.1]
MSISPFKSDSKPRSQQKLVKKKSDDQPLTFSQALTITAGMAGLIGLVSGAFIRFSLTHSSNARFLSPLQTFPALSNWTPDTLADPPNSEADSLSSSTEGDDSLELRQGSTDYPKSFDEFADRSDAFYQTTQDPLEALRSGPLLRESGRFGPGGTDAILPELEDPAFEPYFDPDVETDAEAERSYQ